MTVDIATLGIRIDSREALTAAQSLERMRDSGARAEQQAASLDVVARKLSQALQLLGVGAGVGAIIRMADEYAKFNAQIKLATQSQREYAAAVDDVRRIANTAQQDLAATGTLYARIANGTRELGVQQKQVAAITETVNLALKVSGATAAESASAQLQLSQAFASGTLRGEEFNAVNEAAPRLMKALADGMGVPIGALREMASEGKITSQIMSNVLPSALQQLREEAKQVQTIGGAFTVLKNSVMEFIGTQAQASGAVMALTTGIEALARNLNLLAGVAGTVTAVAVVNWLTAWTVKTYEHIAAIYAQVAAANAARAATIAMAEAEVASTAATTASLAATQSAIVVAREEMVARLAVANANISAAQATIANTDASIAQARAAIAASSAAGALSTALRVLRDSTRELNVQEALRRGLQADLAIAEQARAATLAQLAILGQQQTRVSAQVTAATAAQTAAQTALTAANGATVASVGLLSRAVGFLGGPVGAVITLLGLAATAWSVWGRNAEEGNKQASESFDEAHARIVKGLDEQIAKNERLIQLQNGGISKTKAERDLPIVEQLSKASKLLDDINSRAGDFAPGKGKSNDDILFAREKVLKSIIELNEKMQKRDASDDAAAAFGPAAQALAAVRERLTGVNKQYLDDLKALKTARDANAIGEREYITLVSKLATETWNASDAGKNWAATSKAQVDARLEAIKSGIAREKNLRDEGVARVSELNRQGLASDTEVFNAKHAAALAAGKDAAAVFDAEIAALAAYNGKDAAERIANNAKIKDLGAQRTEALRSSLVAAEQLSNAYAYDKDKPAREAEATSRKEILAINDQIDATERQIAAYNKLPSAVTTAAVAQLEEQKVALAGIEGSEKAIADIDAKIAAYGRLAAAQTTLQGLDTGTDVAKAEQLLKILQAVDDAARQAAQGMEDSFGRVGAAIGGLTTALTGYAVQQQAITAQLAAVKADPKSSAQKIAQAEIAAAKASAQAQIKSYGDMAGAAKGFFSENSKGYKLLETTEKAFRAYEMAMALESMVKKIFFKEGEVAANVALNATKLSGEAATTGASVALAGTEASAWGITAVVKAMASLPFPLNLAAGAVTLAAVLALGAKVMGGTGGGGFDVAKDRQEKAGTGTVLGDESAKSESISRSIENLEKYANVELSHTRDMLSALVKIRDTIGVVAAMATQTSGLRATALDEKKYGVGSSSGVLGIGASSTTIQDSGIKLNGSQTIGSAISGGVDATGYADILKKKSGLWGIGSSSKTSRDVIQLDDDLKNQFGLLVGSMRDGAVEAVKVLGLSTDGILEKINGMALGINEISFKGLTGAEIQKELEAVFSNVGDDIAKLAVPELAKFQQVGEGYLETLTRVATDYATIDSVMEASGRTFGAVGLASIEARERLIKLAGGLDNLISTSQSFNDNFLTEAERLAPVQKYVTSELSKMGLQGITTREQFKGVVLGLDVTTEAGAKQYAAMLALADAFAKTHAATEDMKMSEQELKDQRKEFTNQYDELMLTTAQLAAKARAAIDPYNLALYDQIQAQTAVKDAQAALLDAYDKQKSALQSVIDLQLAAAAATEKQINALKLGTLSDLSPEQKYFEAQRQFDAAAPGEAKSAAAQALLDASRTYNGSTQAYVKDYAKVQAALALQAASQSSAASVAQQQLDALNKQVAPLIDIKDGITGLDATTKAVLDGIQELARATAAAAAANTAAGASGSGQSVEAMVAGIYKDVLGRQGDAAGMDFWIKQIKNGASYSQIYDALKGSDEYKYLNGIKAHAKGGIASGWSLVGEEGPELVNFDTPGRVYTADQSRRMMSGGTSDAAVAEQTAAIREQNALIAKQNELLGAIKDATEDTAENGAAGEDIRSLKQHMAKVLSTRQAVPA